ncbi:MAG: integrin alpha [Planctomycetota bacterium]
MLATAPHVPLLLSAAALLGPPVAAQVAAHQKISDEAGGFGGTLDVIDSFGHASAALGDLDGDGVADLAVGSHFDGDGGAKRGAVWILFLNADGSVKAEQKISATEGGFAGVLDDGDVFGSALAGLGDLDRDGVVDLAVGAPDDDDGAPAAGAVWILFLNADGTVKACRKISAFEGGFAGQLDAGDTFGSALAGLGDHDGDGVVDVAVGAPGDGDGGPQHGAVWVLFLNVDGSVKAERKISDSAGGFAGDLQNADFFGYSVAALGDYDEDGAGELAVGSAEAGFFGHRGIPPSAGAVWVLFLNDDGSVKGERKIGDGIGAFDGELDHFDRFGRGLAALGDLDGDGLQELAVGAPDDDDGGLGLKANQGAVWLLFLAPDATVRAHRKISALAGGFAGELDPFDRFGTSLCAAGDLDGDGLGDLAVGAPEDDDGGTGHGAAWILFLDPVAPATEVVRAGSPPNPVVFFPGRTSAPVVGAVWDPVATPALPAPLLDWMRVSFQPVNVPLGPLGTLLCDPSGAGFVVTSPPGNPFQVAIPQDPEAVGLPFCAQVASVDADATVLLTNALDCVIGTF